MNNNNNQNNPWKKIVENYQEQVEEADTKGYADFYKRCTEHYLFKFIPSRLQEVGLTFTPIDIEYDDGYYVFGRGSNSIVNFRVAEAPGWLFGIWYRIEEELVQADRIIYSCHYDVFAQYEQFIDKFKPSRSTLSLRDLIYDVTPDYVFKDSSFAYNAANMFIFIIKEPALAFCRDQFDWNYNEEYHTREEAEAKMVKTISHEAKNETFKLYATDALLNYVKNFWKGEKVFIKDFGTGISPRYEITFLYEDEEDDTRPICDRIDSMHYLSYIKSQEEDPSDFPDDIKLYEFFKGYHELKTRLEQEADEYDFYWWPEVSTWFSFQSIAHFELWKERVKNNW